MANDWITRNNKANDVQPLKALIRALTEMQSQLKRSNNLIADLQSRYSGKYKPPMTHRVVCILIKNKLLLLLLFFLK